MGINEDIKAVFKSPKQKVIVNIRYTANWLGNLQNNYMAQFDLTMPQFNILRILRGAKDYISVNMVKDRMIEKSPNTTRLMDKLIDKKLIERIRCEEDRRIVYVKISTEGLSLLEEIDKTFESSQFYTQKLTEEEAETLNMLLDKIRS